MTFDTKKLTLAEKKALLREHIYDRDELEAEIKRLKEEIRAESSGPTLWESMHELRESENV